MKYNNRLTRAAGTAAATFVLVGTATQTALAYDEGDTTIACDATNVRASYSEHATSVGMAYKGDKMHYDQWVKNSDEGTI